MFYGGRGFLQVLGMTIIFIGVGMLIATLLSWGWFVSALAIVLIAVGVYFTYNC